LRDWKLEGKGGDERRRTIAGKVGVIEWVNSMMRGKGIEVERTERRDLRLRSKGVGVWVVR